MSHGEQAHEYVVVLRLLSPDPVQPEHVARVEALLADPPAPGWLFLSVRQDVQTVRLRVGVVATGPEDAGRAVVDHVRAALGLDSVLSLWVVDARRAMVTRTE